MQWASGGNPPWRQIASFGITSCVFVTDVDLFPLIRLFLAHDGFDDFRREFAFLGKVPHLNGLGMWRRGKCQSDFFNEILLFDVIKVWQFHSWTQSNTTFIHQFQKLWNAVWLISLINVPDDLYIQFSSSAKWRSLSGGEPLQKVMGKIRPICRVRPQYFFWRQKKEPAYFEKVDWLLVSIIKMA